MADPAVASKVLRTFAVDSGVNYFKFAIGGAGAVGTITELGGGDFVSGVAHTATGRYTVTLQKPYPSAIVFCNPELTVADNDSNLLRCAYKTGSYSATAGTFEINTGDVDGLDGNALAALLMSAEDPASGQEIMVHVAYTN